MATRRGCGNLHTKVLLVEAMLGEEVRRCLAGGTGREGSSLLRLGWPAGAGGGREGSGKLPLGPAAALLHGAALLLLHKAKHTLQDTFELTQKIMLKNYQIDSDCGDSEEESDEHEDSEIERSSLSSVSSSSKRSADTSNDLELSKRVRTSEVSEKESVSSNVSDASYCDELDNDSEENEDNDSQSSSQEEEDDYVEVEDRGVQTCGCGFDPGLKLGVMLLYDDHTQPIPSKILISSINPRANL
ncbi:PREDICTED: uncharacterized protein LOC106118043 isoform X2 [Papilio xuthus]|uniref:Uncharacterized protein LOC106118043 isoform X2 n=1 Tax=Papilio xuthus TaxID=66420 RepID=A0AAJ6Z9Z9_PAPXU|nr:PREDICTED: uncharacterized protein LOC106118043 isoform X2 [Papilio xuthus]